MLNFYRSTGFGIDPDEPSLRTRRSNKKKNPSLKSWGSIKKGDDILSHITAVPSAQAGLTTLFGMGRGEPRRNNHLKVVSCWLSVVGCWILPTTINY